MKKYFICSDIHGRLEILRSCLRREKDIDGVIVAGDLEADRYEITDIIYDAFPGGCTVHMVAGNCDSIMMPGNDAFDAGGGHRIFLTHGHRYRVPQTDLLSYAAESEGCDIAVFGHTHVQFEKREFGILFLNPGAMRNGQYLVLEIADNGEIKAVFK
ncbi:MAG TPA: metallophosphoesterase [Clostridiales bacterium]|nr:metallophosphoesterase [Clostridiales bacterium]